MHLVVLMIRIKVKNYFEKLLASPCSDSLFTTHRGVYNFGLTSSPTPSLRPREPQPMEPQSMGGQPREP